MKMQQAGSDRRLLSVSDPAVHLYGFKFSLFMTKHIEDVS